MLVPTGERPEGQSVDELEALTRDRREALLADLGDDLGREMEALSDKLDAGQAPDWDALRGAVYAYLDSLPGDPHPDPFFNWVGNLALPRARTPFAYMRLWEPALALVLEWEHATGRHAHKGSGFYFAGIRDISFGNIDRGFLYMHQAAIEDAWRNPGTIPDSPAGWFITANGEHEEQAALDIVRRYESYLDGRVRAYCDAARGSLDLVSLRARYRAHGELFAPVTTLTHVVARLTNIDSAQYGPILENRFAPNLRTDLALDLCLVFEDLLQRRHRSELALGGLVAQTPRLRDVDLTTDEVGLLNGRSGTPADFDVLVDELLGTGQATGFPRDLKPREADVAIAISVRNRAAHGGERPTATGQQFDEIVPRLFFAIFAAIEDLYAP